ncbi:girdin isoform X4 [Hydra vulgaris]|uniref:Girdin isoform X4 n=1 Tax=Hydra vulgaris TaxID=6087 RepID=A0ABM4CGV8_HYDVU
MSLLERSSEDFVKTPLVVWIQSYLDTPIKSNTDIVNGVLLKDVLMLIDHATFSGIPLRNNVDDITQRAQNLSEILFTIKRFYQEKLQQLIVMKMPDVLLLAKEPENELSYSEMSSILLLILGCAIQCEMKEKFIEHITELDVTVQRGLVAYIQEITENPENVISYPVNDIPDMSLEDLIPLSLNLYYRVQRVLEQRDEYVETILDLALYNNNEDTMKESPNAHPSLSPHSSFRSQNILQANRQKVFNLQSELDDRSVAVAEMNKEINQLKQQLDNIRRENKRLTTEAAWVTTCRDELDVAKTQLENFNKVNAENAKMKERIRELEFCKNQYDELKQQFELIYEAKVELEEKMAGSSSLIDQYNKYEETNSNLQSQIDALTQEREDDHIRIRELVDQVAKLSREKQESMTACSTMNAELNGLRMQKQDDGINVPLLVEYNQTSSTDLLRLEKENKQLSLIIDNLKTGIPVDKIKQLKESNEQMSENIFQYKNMITTLTKCLLLEKNANRELGDVIGNQSEKMAKLYSSQALFFNELEDITKKLVEQGLILDLDVLKEVWHSEFGSFEKKTGQTHIHNNLQNEEIQERMTNLLGAAGENTKKINKLLDDKVDRIKSLESKITLIEDNSKELEQVQVNLKNKETKLNVLHDMVKSSVEKIRSLELELERSNASSSYLEHELKLKNERINILEASLTELSTSASNMHTERIALLMKSLDFRDNEINDLKHKVDELMNLNEKLRSMNNSKCDDIQKLEIQLQEMNINQTKPNHYDEIKSLQNDLIQKKSEIDLLELKIQELENSVSKLKRINEHSQEKCMQLELKIQDYNEVVQDKERANRLIDDKNKKCLDLEMEVDSLNNEKKKLERMLKQSDEQYKLAAQSLCTLEASIVDQSSLSKLIKLKESKLESMQNAIDEKDDCIVKLETQLLDSVGKIKRIEQLIKLKDEKLQHAENNMEKFDDIEAKNLKLNALLQQKEQKIQLLEDNMDQLGELARSNNRLKEHSLLKDKKIENLEERIHTLEEAVKMNEILNHQVKTKEENILFLQEKVYELELQLQKSEQIREIIKKNAESEILKLNQEVTEFSDFKVKRQMSLLRRDQKITNLEYRLNSFAEEQQQKDSFIQDLQSKLEGTMLQYRKLDLSNEEKDQKLVDLDMRVKELMHTYEENQKLSKALQIKEEKFHELKKQNEDFEESGKRSLQQLENKEKTIVELQERLQETLMINNRLNCSVKVSEVKINTLEKQVLDQEELVEKLSSSIKIKDRTIERNSLKFKELEEEFNKQIAELQNELDNTKKLAEELRAPNEKEISTAKQIADLSKMVENQVALKKEADLRETELKKVINEFENEKHKSKLILQEKDGVIADLGRRIEELQFTISGSDKLNFILNEKNNQITILRQSLDEYQRLNAQLETRLEEITSERNRFMTAMKLQEERLKTLKNQLEEYVKLNHKTSNDLQLKEETLISVTNSLDEMKRRNKDLEEDINSLEKDLHDLKSTGSLKNITNITEKIQLTKRARTELHIQRGPITSSKMIEIKMLSVKPEDVVKEKNEVIERLQNEIDILEKQKSHISALMSTISMENALYLSENESLKSSYELLTLDYEALQKEMSNVKNQFQELDISATKIAQRCELLVQMNHTLDEENKALIDQNNKLILQSKELLFSTLQSRDQFLDDERIFSDHIYGLEREREILAEKVQAAERALQDTGNKKKGALWRGTNKIFKKVGLKKKTSNTDIGEFSLSSDGQLPNRPKITSLDSVIKVPTPTTIRGLVSKGRADSTNIDHEKRQSFINDNSSESDTSSKYSFKNRPKSEFFGFNDLESPLNRRKDLFRSLENVSQSGISFQNPLDFSTSSSNERSSREQHFEEYKMTSPSKTSSNGNQSDRSSVEGNNTPIQKVLVKQITTAEVLKTPKDNEILNECLDYMARETEDFSERSLSFISSNETNQAFEVQDEHAENSSHEKIQRRSSMPLNNDNRPYEVLTDNRGTFFFQRSDSVRSTRSSSKLSNTSENKRQEKQNIFYQRDSRGKSLSPPIPVYFGNREHRSSFRRYEIEQMEPRPLNSDIEKESSNFTDINRNKHKSLNLENSDEHQSSFRRSDSNRQSKRKTWYEYGNV